MRFWNIISIRMLFIRNLDILILYVSEVIYVMKFSDFFLNWQDSIFTLEKNEKN